MLIKEYVSTWRETSRASGLCPCPRQSNAVIPDRNEDITDRLFTFMDTRSLEGERGQGMIEARSKMILAEWPSEANLIR